MGLPFQRLRMKTSGLANQIASENLSSREGGVRFSPPVNREVTSQDVKYAIERGFFSTVANGYAQAYLCDIVGARFS